jgi:hypothetical protein
MGDKKILFFGEDHVQSATECTLRLLTAHPASAFSGDNVIHRV